MLAAAFEDDAGRSRTSLEDDDRDRAVCGLFVASEGGHELLLAGPDLVALFAFSDSSGDGDGVGAEFDSDLGGGEEAEVPGGVGGAAAVGGEDGPAVVIEGLAGEWGDVGVTGL